MASVRYAVCEGRMLDWYHVTGNTYGVWLPGDPRGTRTRHARPRHTPSLSDAEVLIASERTMTRSSITLSPEARCAACAAMIGAFRLHAITCEILAVTSRHFHLLAMFPDDLPRKWVGIAKKESARELSRGALVPVGGVWAIRTHCKPIRDHIHWQDVRFYIAAHAAEGAAIWTAG